MNDTTREHASEGDGTTGPHTFDQLITSIEATSRELSRAAKVAVNTSLTLRNWLIGCYIEKYQLHGADRAAYGDNLLPHLSVALKEVGVRAAGRRQLYQYLSFYRSYPQIVRTVSAQLLAVLPGLQGRVEKEQATLAAAPSKRVAPPSPKSGDADEGLLAKLSYSHFEQLVRIEDADKRRFYEEHCLRGMWSVRELSRQIGSLYYERTALSKDKVTLSKRSAAVAEKLSSAIDIRDPYVFEFLGLRPAEVMGESELEDALIDKLQDFLLELGHGFCFEARHKRLLIGQTYNFVDLVFYHRLLKCHVLIELKVDKFTHEHVGQLNTYVSWYADNEMAEGDNPPIGLLLCSEKDHTVVKYALAGMSNRLFVSKYQVALPSEETLRGVVESATAHATGGG